MLDRHTKDDPPLGPIELAHCKSDPIDSENADDAEVKIRPEANQLEQMIFGTLNVPGVIAVVLRCSGRWLRF